MVKKTVIEPARYMLNTSAEDYSPNVEDFPGCCGVSVLFYFPEDAVVPVTYSDWYADMVDEGVEEEQLDRKRYVRDTYPTQERALLQWYAQNIQPRSPCTLITLITQYRGDRASQCPEIRDLLVRKGFEPLKTFRGNTGHQITLFAKIAPRKRVRNQWVGS